MAQKTLHCAIVSLLLAGIVSCSSDLSRGEAERVIAENYPADITHLFDFESTTYGLVWIGWTEQEVLDRIAEVEETLNYLQEAGYITWRKRYQRPYYGTRLYNYVVTPTEQLTPYIETAENSAYTVVVGEAWLDEITGITARGESEREVNYTIDYNYNELGEILLTEEQRKDREERKASFRKYDDGWRMQ